MQIKWLLMLIALLGLVSVTAWAQPPDAAEDSERPARANLLSRFPLMMVLDADQNGEISGREMKRAAAALRTLDVDEDGKLSEEELRPEFPSFGPGGNPSGSGPGGRFPGGGPGGGGPGGSGRGRRGGQPGGPFNPESFVTRCMEFDQNQDGVLSKDELTMMAQQFMRRPPNGAGRPGGPPGIPPNDLPPDAQ